MKSILNVIAVMFAAIVLANCSYNAGLLYEDVVQPRIQAEFGTNSTVLNWDSNLNSSINARTVTKSGKACSKDILKLVAWGDGSQAAAAKNGGISKISALDFEVTAILGFLYTESCTVVIGE